MKRLRRRWFGPGRRARTRVVGVHLSETVIRVACVEHAGARPEVVALERRALDEAHPPVVPNQPVERDLVGVTELRRLLQTVARPAARCVTSVSGPDVWVRSLAVGREADAADTVGRIREQMRHDPDHIVTGHIVPAPHHEAGVSRAGRATVVVARRSVVEERIRWVRAAGGTPEAIEVDALALHNAFVHAHPEALEGTAAVLWVGSTASCINVVDDGLLERVRELPLGLTSMYDDEGLESLRRLLHASDSDADLPAPGRLFVAGPGGCDPALLDRLGEHTRIETRAIRLQRAFVLGPGLAPADGADLGLPDYAVALGLALSGA